MTVCGEVGELHQNKGKLSRDPVREVDEQLRLAVWRRSSAEEMVTSTRFSRCARARGSSPFIEGGRGHAVGARAGHEEVAG